MTRQIVNIPARSVAGMVVKARMLKALFREAHTDLEWPAIDHYTTGENKDDKDAVAVSLVCDVERLAGDVS